MTQKDVAEFFKLMELGSIDNNCAFGFFNDQVLHKNKGRFNLAGFNKNPKLLNSNFLVGHNRLATTGSKEQLCNNHPFAKNDFILVHNGTIDNNLELRSRFTIPSDIQTDSYAILWLIDYYFQKSEIQCRQQRFCNAIQKTTEKLSGSFSVLLYDTVSANLYYFKNRATSFSFCLFGDTVLVGSTNPVNLEHVYLNDKYILDADLFKKRTIKQVESNKIYLISTDLAIKELGSFESHDGFFWNSFSDHGWQDPDLIEYMSMTNDDKIQVAFQNCLGYIPEFKFSESTGMVKLKYNKAVLSDLRHFVQTLFCEKGCIFFDADELLSYMGDFF